MGANQLNSSLGELWRVGWEPQLSVLRRHARGSSTTSQGNQDREMYGGEQKMQEWRSPKLGRPAAVSSSADWRETFKRQANTG